MDASLDFIKIMGFVSPGVGGGRQLEDICSGFLFLFQLFPLQASPLCEGTSHAAAGKFHKFSFNPLLLRHRCLQTEAETKREAANQRS